MSFAKALSFVVVAAVVSACSDVSAPTQVSPAPASALASKGGSGGGGGGGGGGGSAQPVVTSAPTVNTTGTWIGTTDGPDVIHTYTFTLTQDGSGMVSGVAAMRTATQNSFALVIGTVNADTLTLYMGPGTVSPGAQLSLYFRGIVSARSSRLDGGFISGGSPLTLYKQ
jgi:hypothetical protein